MTWNIHLYLSSREKLREERHRLEKDIEQRDSPDKESVLRQLSDVNEEIARRLSN